MVRQWLSQASRNGYVQQIKEGESVYRIGGASYHTAMEKKQSDILSCHRWRTEYIKVGG